MLLPLHRSPALEQRLPQAAQRQGRSLDTYALPLRAPSLPPNEQHPALVTLLQSWMEDGAPDEQRDTGASLLRALEADRLAERQRFPPAGTGGPGERGGGRAASPRGLGANPRRAQPRGAGAHGVQAWGARARRGSVPEIAAAAGRRELLRAQRGKGLARRAGRTKLLEARPRTPAARRPAAVLGAQARQQGQPTVEAQALDGEGMLATQARPLGGTNVGSATTQGGHLSRCAPAAVWLALPVP
jgi:hypothetical protein